MSKFRGKAIGTKTKNFEGAEAFSETPELELISLLLTSFVQDKFYESADDQLQRLGVVVNAIKDKKFAAKAAIYARNEFGMRSITHALLSELAKTVKGKSWTRVAITKAMRRPDDMLETLAYYINTYGKPIPNSLKKGLRDSLEKFDSYQLAKYQGKKSSLKLTDLFNLIHPKAPEGSEALYKQIIDGKLKSKDTWETKHTQAGQKASKIEDKTEREEKLKELKEKTWTDLLTSKRLGYFALLRNLRNILEQAPDMIDEVAKQLTNEIAIKNSLVLPFRFTSAMKEIEKTSFDGSRKVITALSEAFDISMQNVPKFDGKTLVVLDESGSMDGKPMDIGALFAAILYKSNDADLMMFSNTARYRTLNPTDSGLTIAEQIKKEIEWGGTNFHCIFSKATKAYDRVIILSDMQGWMSEGNYEGVPTKSFNAYKKRTGASPKIYSFDLQGYGSLQFPEKNIFCIAGWSDKIFDVMKMLEQDRDALIKTIENYVEL